MKNHDIEPKDSCASNKISWPFYDVKRYVERQIKLAYHAIISL